MVRPGSWIFEDAQRQYGAHRPVAAGSVGLVVRDLVPRADDEDDVVVLTAAHAFPAGLGAAVKIAAPRPIPPASHEGQYFGTVRRLVPSTRPTSPCAVDAAVIKPEKGLKWKYENEIDGRQPSGSVDLLNQLADDAIPVMKHGAASGLTRGTLFPVVADHVVWDVPARYTCGWWTLGDDVQFAKEGDSGAVVVDDNLAVVGMAVAIESPQLEDSRDVACFTHGIRAIMSALQIELL